MGVGGNQPVVGGVVPEAYLLHLLLVCNVPRRRWGSPTLTKVKNILPPEPPHVL